MKLIDFRVRPPVAGFEHASMYARPERTEAMGAVFGFPGAMPPSLRTRSPRDFQAERRATGIGLCVLPGRVGAPGVGPADNALLVDYAASEDGLCAFPAVDPLAPGWENAIDALHRRSPAAVRGLVLEPGLLASPLYPDDERCEPVYAYCAARGWPLILSAGGNIGPDCGFSLPVHVDRVARDFPELPIVVAHGGWPWITAINHVAFRRGNVYISPDMYALMPGNEAFLVAMNSYLSERYLYASSYPFVPLTAYRDAFLGKIASDTVAERVLFLNAANLLGLDAP
ncbi:amidohydrolase family protein [Pigmentiphaga sp.]|uniref:amidohydrolase family protein n=1 Tax=Pigmentiphaga sp. TaxID=1977564 RepID=UPI0025FB07FF|nr:amidohydrolase family protein [Pigmentiphaga sp.]